MYAAGHPPLVGFEIETFADKMPRHWRYSRELASPDEVDADPPFVRTRNVLIGSVVSLRMAVELAMADATSPADSNRWPELARMDCFACHHELLEPGWRQFRPVSTTLGRPQLAVSCIPLVAVAAELEKSDSRDDFSTVLARLREPFAEDAFGDRAKLASQGAVVVAWCRALENSLEKMDFGPDNGPSAARFALRALAKHGKDELYDFDTARQVYGAWLVVYDELVQNQAIQLPNVARQKLDAKLAQIGGTDPFVLERNLLLVPCTPPLEGQKPETESQREADLKKLFDKRTRYQPAKFAEALATLAELLDE
jgi:hypothetical protein